MFPRNTLHIDEIQNGNADRVRAILLIRIHIINIYVLTVCIDLAETTSYLILSSGYDM